MDVLEMVRTKVKELTDPDGPANEMLHSAKSAVAHGLDGAGRFVDEKTHGKYSSTITSGVGKAKEFLREQEDEPPHGEQSGPRGEARAGMGKSCHPATEWKERPGTYPNRAPSEQQEAEARRQAQGQQTQPTGIPVDAPMPKPKAKSKPKAKAGTKQTAARPPTPEPPQSAADEPPHTEHPLTY
jgi:hypothetical protein